jgi:hypothetical protein
MVQAASLSSLLIGEQSLIQEEPPLSAPTDVTEAMTCLMQAMVHAASLVSLITGKRAFGHERVDN